MSTEDYETYKLGDWELQSGEKIVNAHIAFKTFGDPKSPAILYPSWFSGCKLAKHASSLNPFSLTTLMIVLHPVLSDNFWLIGEDKTLNPKEYFIIVTGLFGNGQSSSPSNQPKPCPFPKVAFYDNVRAQHELITKHFGISHLRAVVGWSMGAGQTFQWATQYPDFMDLAVPFCGSAKTSLHNQVFLEGVKSSLLAVKNTRSAGSGEIGIQEDSVKHRAWTAEEKDVGLKALGRVYAGW